MDSRAGVARIDRLKVTDGGKGGETTEGAHVTVSFPLLERVFGVEFWEQQNRVCCTADVLKLFVQYPFSSVFPTTLGLLRPPPFFLACVLFGTDVVLFKLQGEGGEGERRRGIIFPKFYLVQW